MRSGKNSRRNYALLIPRNQTCFPFFLQIFPSVAPEHSGFFVLPLFSKLSRLSERFDAYVLLAWPEFHQRSDTFFLALSSSGSLQLWTSKVSINAKKLTRRILPQRVSFPCLCELLHETEGTSRYPSKLQLLPDLFENTRKQVSLELILRTFDLISWYIVNNITKIRLIVILLLIHEIMVFVW